ncbi:MAG: hypothetical protein ACAH88_16765, partial [Roseimicrobium sp.]
SWLRQQQGNGAMADALGWDELNGFGFQHHARLPEILDGVTEAQVQEAASRFFQLDRAFTVRVKP